MRAVGLVLAAQSRRQWRSWLALGVLIALVSGFVLAAAAVLLPALRGQAVPIEAPAPNATAGLWRPFDEAALSTADLLQPGSLNSSGGRQIVFFSASQSQRMDCS